MVVSCSFHVFLSGLGLFISRHLPTLDLVRCGLADLLGYAPVVQGCEISNYHRPNSPSYESKGFVEF